MMYPNKETRGIEKYAAEIRGILESLAEDEPIGDAVRREARYVVAEIEKLQRQHEADQQATQ